MKITDVKIKTVTGDTKLKAIVSVVIENILVIHDIKLIEGKHGLFIGFPSRQTNNKEFIEYVTVKNKEFKEEITNLVIKNYNDALDIIKSKESNL